jgi:hypothetical protein
MIEPIPDFASWLESQTITRKIDSLVLHHTYRPTTKQYEGAKTIEAIRQYHLSKGWRDIGYHVLVGPEGAIWPGRLLDWTGAHAVIDKPEMVKFFGSPGYLNKFSVGVCAIGDYDAEEPSTPLLSRLQEVLFQLAQRFRIPAERLFFHRQVAPKSCPGQNFDLDATRTWLKPEPVVPAWATDSWRWAQTKGLILGEPDAAVDRQALSAVLYRYDKLKGSGQWPEQRARG